MKTDDLIRALAVDKVRAPALRSTLLAGLVPSLLIAVLGVWLVLGFRADLGTAMVTPVPGVGPVISTALVAAVGQGEAFDH